MRTLVLNATYEPLGVTSIRRAVRLTMTGHAEVIEASGELLRGATVSFDAPLVVRLTVFVRVNRRRTVPFSRAAVLRRDRYRCAYCNRYADTVDHVIPKARGGSSGFRNLVAACRACNSRKDARTPKEAGMVLRTVPAEPAGPEAFAVSVRDIPAAWRPWLGTTFDRELVHAS